MKEEPGDWNGRCDNGVDLENGENPASKRTEMLERVRRQQ